MTEMTERMSNGKKAKKNTSKSMKEKSKVKEKIN